jgi:AcrR family transcriptional regulator
VTGVNIMQKGQPHPAANVSKSMLANGLLDLLIKRSYSDITITELCAHSQIARRTFYRNFNSIDEVLEYYINNLIKDFESEMLRHAAKEYGIVITAYFTFWLKQADFLRLLNRNGLSYIIFTQYIKCLINLPFICNYDMTKTFNEQVFNCKFAYSAGGLWSLLSYWNERGCVETPEELAHILLI